MGSRIPWLETLINARERTDVEQAFNQLLKIQGWKHYAFAGMLPTGTGGYVYATLHNYAGSDWAARYDRLPDRSDDAVVRYAKQNTPPVAWTSDGRVYGADLTLWDGARELLRNAGKAGLKAGIAAPCRARELDWAFIILSGPAQLDRLELEDRLVEASLFAQHCVNAMIGLVERSAIALTPIERDCLTWCADGYTAEQIAPKVGLAKRTVHKHLQSVTHKMGARSLTHACVVAAKRRILV
jgi:DNA-binding CsgD family transcriptional regulator